MFAALWLVQIASVSTRLRSRKVVFGVKYQVRGNSGAKSGAEGGGSA